MNIYMNQYLSPVGSLTLVSDGTSITGLSFSDKLPDYATVSLPVFSQTLKWLDDYFAAKHPDPTQIPLAAHGTPFQEEVWYLLRQIPYGQSVTYGHLAGMIAKKRGIEKMSAQAVGQAVSANPIAIIIPCHRVLAAKNRIGGYAYGMNIKKTLLELENIDFIK